MKKHYFENTQYPHIFERTYWGQCPFANNDNDASPEIFQNRNNLITKYNIIQNVDILDSFDMSTQQFLSKEWNKLRGFVDHTECYLTDNDNFILISSPYSHFCDDSYNHKYSENGWIKIDNIYHQTANSYLKIIPGY